MSSTTAAQSSSADATSPPAPAQKAGPSPADNTQTQRPPEAEAGSSRLANPDLLRRQMAHCGEYTFQALNKIGKLSPEDAGKITQRYLKSIQSTEKGSAFPDALTFLVMDGWKKDEIEARDIVLGLTRALLHYTKTKISHIAFAHQNETPIEFYNDFPVISEISRLLSSPIIQVSEKDFFTVTSINPFTATAAARLIANEIESEVGKRAFQFVTTTDLTAWKYTCERHFGT